MSRNRQLAVLGTAALSLTIACGFEPSAPTLSYSLNDSDYYLRKVYPDFYEDPLAQARLKGGLEFLVGTPSSPSYLVREDWRDEEFNPNRWGYDYLSDDQWGALVDSNREHFRRQIAAIEAGDFDAVPHTRYADDLWEDWLAYRAGDEPPEEAVALFENYYPTLASSARFYRQQCYHCHGTEGGGDGSTAPFLTPPPRDYRLGVFKFTAIGRHRPRHEDLFRILREGLYTTAMPSFRRFSDARLHGVIDYVRLLAIRGETEVLMILDYDADEGGFDLEQLQDNYALVVERWRSAADNLIVYDGDVPEATPERIAHGRWLFTSADGANCMKCHGEGGRGDGPSVSEPENSIDEWGNEIKPRDLTRGVFRLGRRPIGLYRRIYAGIYGTPMPEHIGQQITESDGTKRPLSEEDVWDLVFFVRSLSSHQIEASSPGGSSGQ